MTTAGWIGAVALYLALINLQTFALFGRDKTRAIQGRRRVLESDLLTLALVGGSPAALLARRVFRHKTRKEPFGTRLMLIVAIQISAGIGLLLL